MAEPGSNGSFALRQLVEELGVQMRSGVERLVDLPFGTAERLARELGLVTRTEWESLELRVAQVEHRLKLLERDTSARTRPRLKASAVSGTDVVPG